MKRSLRNNGILVDDDAQALTEFVIIIPIILLMFFATLQTSVIAQTSQLCNYAAFNAARTYATNYSLFLKEKAGNGAAAHNAAKQRAKSAATFVLAPVSHAQLGEALMVWNPLRAAAEGLPTDLENAYSLAEGYVVAWLYRLKNFDITAVQGTKDVGLSHDSPPSDGDRKKTLHCSFDYLCPLTIPGLREMWNYLYSGDGPVSRYDSMGTFDQHWTGGYILDIAAVSDMTAFVNEFQNFLVDLATTLSGLGGGGILGDILGDLGIGGGFLHDLNVKIDGLITGVYGIVPVIGATANIPIHAKCEMGFEPWSGTARLKGGDDAATPTPELEACMETISNNQERVNATGAWLAVECEPFYTASNNWVIAKQELDTCQTDTNHPNHNTGCAGELIEEDEKRQIRDLNEPRCEDAGDVMKQVQDENAQASKDACSDIGGNAPFDPDGQLGGL